LFATDAPFDAEQGRGLIGKTIAAVDALDIDDESGSGSSAAMPARC